MVEEWRRDQLEREVRAHERELQDQRSRRPSCRRARRRRGGRRRRTRAGPRARRTARRRSRRGRRQRGGQADGAGGRHGQAQVLGSAVNFDGHFVTSESGWPSKTRPACARRSRSRGPRGTGRAPGRRSAPATLAPLPSRSSTRNVCTVPCVLPAPLATRPVSWYVLPGFGAGELARLARLAGGGEARVDERAGEQQRAVSATTSRVLRLRDGSIALQYGDWTGATASLSTSAAEDA